MQFSIFSVTGGESRIGSYRENLHLAHFSDGEQLPALPGRVEEPRVRGPAGRTRKAVQRVGMIVRDPKGILVGILLLEDTSMLFAGCLGNPETFPFRTLSRRVPGASIRRVLAGDTTLLPAFVQEARALEAEGVAAITTNCGFTSIFQAALTSEIRVPILTSSLLLIPLLQSLIPPSGELGIVTYDARQLSEGQFRGAGWSGRDIPVRIIGVEDQPAWELPMRRVDAQAIRGMEKALLTVCGRFLRQFPRVAALVLECGGMLPFSRTIRRTLGIPTYDIASLVALVVAGMTAEPGGTTAEGAGLPLGQG